MDKRIERMIERLSGGQEAYLKAKETFEGRLATDPVYAFEWADSVMALAARAAVFEELIRHIKFSQDSEDGTPALPYEELIKNLSQYLMNEVVNMARNPRSSTSVSHDFMHQQRLAALAEALQDLKFS